MISSLVLPRQTTSLDPLPTDLTPFLSYSYSLLRAPKKLNSFRIKQMQPLFRKHPGGVGASQRYGPGASLTKQTGRIPDTVS